MGHNLKRNYFDLAELEKSGIATITSIFGSPIIESEKAKVHSFVDLKLKSLGDFGKVLSTYNFKDHSTSLMDPFSPTAGSSKRPRAPSSGGQTVLCLVDGCKADLSKCRDYHRRHKVCEVHSKTPRVTIGGHEQRFCQQCSRFHSLGEFDEGKRSCRKRLEGHNRRRRKPQPEPLPMNQGNLLSATQGSRYLAFGNQPIIPATSAWSGPVKSEGNPSIYSSTSVSSSFSNAYRGRQFPFLQVPETPLPGVSSAGQTIQVLDSDRALSLLSSSTVETPEMGLGRIIHQPSPMNPNRPTVPGLNYSTLTSQYPGSSQGHGLEGFPESSGLYSSMRSNNNLCQDVFPNDTDASSGGGGHQTLSFTWD